MLNLYIDKKIIEQLEKYAEEKGQTKTIAVERLLTKALDIEENKKDQHLNASFFCTYFHYYVL